MSSLRTLIESIVTDLINARYDADLQTANLAERYRDNEFLRSFNIPSLNISSVSVELRIAFDDQAIEEADTPSEEQISAVDTGAKELAGLVMGLDPVKRRFTTARLRNGFSRSLIVELKKSLAETLSGAPRMRREKIQAVIQAGLSRNRIVLNAADKKRLTQEIQKIEAVIASAPKAPPKSIPGVLVGIGVLSNIDPAAISLVKFEIDLNNARWNDVEEPGGAIKSVLSED